MGGLFEKLSGAKGARIEAESAQNLANFNAEVQKQEAKAIRAKAAFAQKRQAKKAVSIKSALTAKIAKAGGLGSPVAADLAAEQAAELELENLLIGFEGEIGAQKALTQAEIDKFSGRVAKLRGKNLARAANVKLGIQLATLGTGSQFLTGLTPSANQARFIPTA